MSNPTIPLKWVVLVAVADVPEGKGILVKHGRLDILIFRVDGEWTAFENTCPHAGAPIYPDHFDGQCVTCAYHGIRFRTSDGVCPDAAGWSLEQFPVRVEGDQVLVGFPDLG